MTDKKLMDGLFVSDDGELGCFPDHTDERFFYLGPTRWDRLSVPYFVPESVAAGILRLIRERDEALMRQEELRQSGCEWEQAEWTRKQERNEAVVERDEAQEAAEEYWEAWQEQYERCRDILAEGLAQEIVLENDRDRLREALKTYGVHHRECPLADSIARLRGAVACTCGLDELLEDTLKEPPDNA